MLGLCLLKVKNQQLRRFDDGNDETRKHDRIVNLE